MITAQSLRTWDELEAVQHEWAALHAASRPGSPFEHPAWAMAWARSFVPDGDLECIGIRDGGPDGQLIGFAPLYRHRAGVGALAVECVRPLGTGRGQALTEVVQVLALPERGAQVLRAVVRHLEELPGWQWLHISLGPEQGWFVPQWLRDEPAHLIEHRATRPCVVVSPLPADVDDLLRSLKRNVRESVRRAHNRSARLGGVTMLAATDVPAVLSGLEDVTRLHRERSRLRGKIAHGDVLRAPARREFLAAAVRGLAAHGLARVHLAQHKDDVVAALLVLSDGDTDYLSVSGFDPGYWSLGLNTALTFEALAHAVRAGRTAVNLSSGPDVAKLRWSTRIRTWNDFAVVRPDPLSRCLYGTYSHVSLSLRHRQERRRHRIRR
jgi:CelD/BcsL family acetyltransferase involved in cellulose biosynthesis